MYKIVNFRLIGDKKKSQIIYKTKINAIKKVQLLRNDGIMAFYKKLEGNS